MKVVLLTTDTPHHAYIAWEIYNRFSLQAVFFETEYVKPPFATTHEFEGVQVKYEREKLKTGSHRHISDFAPVSSYRSMNDVACIQNLREIAPHVVIVAGTGLLKEPIIKVASQACLNLHGGYPEMYRGLDSQLWAIFYEQFDCLVATLHYIDVRLDTGDIVMQHQLELSRNTKLYELRAINAMACANLVCMALSLQEQYGKMPRRRQQRQGSYYSHMSGEHKEICLRKFNKHVAGL